MAKRLTIIYVAVLLGLTLLPLFGLDREDPIIVQLTPFQTIRTALHDGIRSRDFFLLIGNIVMFMPLGVLVPVLRGRPGWLPVFGWALLLSGGIELTQLAISLLLGFGYRTANVDDVITNVAGALLGYAVFVAYQAWRRRQSAPGGMPEDPTAAANR